MKRSSIFEIIYTFSIATSVYILVRSLDLANNISNEVLKLLFEIFPIILAFYFIAFRLFYTTTKDHPRSLSIALIGPSFAGKTVYLTMLFRELEQGEIRNLMFAPYGTQTIEKVAYDISQMENGKFPQPTPVDFHFRYEAIASYGASMFSRRYRLRIDDYAGEHLDEFDISSDKWLHDSEFFGYVLQSDALLMMIDCERLIKVEENPLLNSISIIENKLIATLHELVQKKNVNPMDKFDMPIGLIISKSDLIKSTNDNEILLNKVSRLIKVCSKRFKYFRIFFVSSTGTTPEFIDGVNIPPKKLHPIGITDPILWIMGK